MHLTASSTVLRSLLGFDCVPPWSLVAERVGVAHGLEVGDLVGLDTGQCVGLEFCQDATGAAVRMVLGLKFLQREVLKACPLAKRALSRSDSGGPQRSEENLDGAQRAVQSKGRSREVDD
jgi:hypothetical protein